MNFCKTIKEFAIITVGTAVVLSEINIQNECIVAIQ